MIMLLESDADRLETLLRELYTFTGWDEARYLLDRMAQARTGYTDAATVPPSDGRSLAVATRGWSVPQS